MDCRRDRAGRDNFLIILIFPAALALTASRTAEQIVSSTTHSLQVRDSAHVAFTACEIAAAVRSPSTPTRCRVESLRETRREFIVRLRETLLRPGATLDYPRSEVRLQKDGTGAVLTRIPQL